MTPTRTVSSRYARAARRSLYARKAALAALVLVPGVACGTGDAEVFESANTTASSSASTPTSAAPSDSSTTEVSTEVATSTTPPTSAATETTTTPDLPVAPAVFPALAELVVSFSYVPEARGVENPYVAVWVEDLEGNLVQTISLWYEQSRKGGRWLSDLPQWYSASGQASDVTMSSATRVAGDYAVAWDGSGLDGQPVVGGDYLVFVEAAREHGPYQVTSQLITIGSEAFIVQLADDGELSNVSASLIA